MGFLARTAALVKRRVGKLRKKKVKHRADLAAVSPEEELVPHTTWKEGGLEKKGKPERSLYQQRHIILTTDYVSYGNPDGGATLDRIYFGDVAGIACGDLDEWEWDQHFRDEKEFGDERWKAKETSAGFSNFEFAIVTKKDSYHNGRVFQFRAPTVEDKEAWVASLVRVLAYHRDNNIEPIKFNMLQTARRSVRWFYLGDRCQITVAALVSCPPPATPRKFPVVPAQKSDLRAWTLADLYEFSL